jgi:hypothetical protein
MGTKYSVTENWFVGNTFFERYLYSVGTTCISIGNTDENTSHKLLVQITEENTVE